MRSWLQDNTHIVTTSVDKTVKVRTYCFSHMLGVEDDDRRTGEGGCCRFPCHELLSVLHHGLWHLRRDRVFSVVPVH